MIPGILGKKLGMTQIFTEEGRKVPVTVLEAGPCQVQQIKTVDNDGYFSVQIGFRKTKEARVKKPQREYFKKNGLDFMKISREIRCKENADIKVGDIVTTEDFQKGDFFDVTGTSKGKGFQGGVKRCGWAGGKATHGSKTHRVPGSIGASASPARVFKGQAMPGQMGNAKVTVQNIEVIDVDNENGTISLRGSIPGANGSYILMVLSKKMPQKPRPEKPQPEQEEDKADQSVDEKADGSPAKEREEISEPENAQDSDAENKVESSEAPAENKEDDKND